MKEYHFNSVIEGRTWLIALVLVVALVSTIVLNHIFFQLAEWWIIVITIVLLVLFYWVARKLSVHQTVLAFDENKISITRNGKYQLIPISSIVSYKITHLNGVRIDMRLASGNRITLVGSDYFYNWEPLEHFCTDFEDYIHTLPNIDKGFSRSNEEHTIPSEQQMDKITNKEHLIASTSIPSIRMENIEPAIPRREKSFYEKKYALPLLLIFSVLVITIVIYIYFIDKGSINGPMITGIAGLISMWGAYFYQTVK